MKKIEEIIIKPNAKKRRKGLNQSREVDPDQDQKVEVAIEVVPDHIHQKVEKIQEKEKNLNTSIKNQKRMQERNLNQNQKSR